MRHLLVMLISIGFSSALAHAETAKNTYDLYRKFRIYNYMYSDENYRSMLSIAKQADRNFGLACSQPYELENIAVGLISPIELPDLARVPTKGDWFAQFDAVRCGKTKTYSMIVKEDSSGPRKSMGLPGNTVAIPLADKATKAAFDYANKVHKCGSYEVFDTQKKEPVPEDNVRETWTITGCGRTITVSMKFVRDGVGGTYIYASGSK